MTDTPTVVFGLDGACLDLVRPWIDDGRLPSLADVIDRGGVTPVASTVPATTPPAWTSLTTGVNPGKHGIFGFYARQRGTYDLTPVSDALVDRRRLWDYATEADLTSCVLNVPVTHPPRPVDGCLVPGYMAPDDPATHPEGVVEDLGLDDYRVYAAAESDADADDETLLEQWLTLTARRADLAVAAHERYDPDLLFLEFQKTDAAVHTFDDEERIAAIYEAVDDAMARVLDAVGGDPNVVVTSDHGIGQEKHWSVALNTWLAEEGYLETAVGGSDREAWGPSSDDDVDVDDEPGSRLASVMGRLDAVGLTKQRLERTLSALGLYDLVARMAPAGLGSSLPEETVDRPRSVAFYENMGFSGVDVGVAINDSRFYPDGVVGADDYDAVRDGLMEALAELRGPDGARAFESVRPREAVYEGPLVDLAPDVVLEQAEDYVIGSHSPRGQVFVEQAHRIDHTRRGLLAAAGPDVGDGWSSDAAPGVADVAPTVLALLDVAPDVTMDGRPIDAVLRSSAPEPRDRGAFDNPNAGDDRLDEGHDAVRERLERMGYLE